MITFEEVDKLLKYDPETGIFTWKVDRGSAAKKDGIAGTLINDGYIVIHISGRIYRAHRLAFLYMTRNHPSGIIDHINRIRQDNRWKNLVECSKADNANNKSTLRNNTSGYQGISWAKRDNKWEVKLKRYGVIYRIGKFNDINTAVAARNTFLENFMVPKQEPIFIKNSHTLTEELTFDIVNSLFRYDPITGFIHTRYSNNIVKVGTIIGSLAGSSGYLRMMILKKTYKVHRIAWLLHYGELPKGVIDHIDGNRSNNSLNNLRDITKSQNSKNRKLHTNNSSGHTGLTWRKSGKWEVKLVKDGENIYLGRFINKEDAIEAYKKASLEAYPEISGGLR